MEKVMPFLWMNKETREELAGEIEYIHEMGLDSFIVESRVHEDFCGEKWFSEMDYILSIAKEKGMKVWVLDDKRFPTGKANGVIQACYPEDNAWHIKVEKTDVAGEVKNAKIILRADLSSGDRILGAFLAKRCERQDVYEDIVDVSSGIMGNMLYIDIPDGSYSVLTLVKTLSCSEKKFYIDMLNPHSVHRLIEAVYEPHYKRYARYFGNTFAGFFSDEPRFSNGKYGDVSHGNEYEYLLGRFGIAHPWSDEVGEKLGVPVKKLLALWFDIGTESADIRVRYMELITDMYGQNFNSQLAQWCHEHGVQYNGHIIEDMGAHARLGCSSGHYFKSMIGADLACVDVVLHQIKPYERNLPHYAPISGGYADPLFFDYTLAKLASSDARLDPSKKGRACCEIFGAYGWCESTSEMIYLVNHMLVRGINHFIPHAFYHRLGFEDCPPHFYAGLSTQTDRSNAAMFGYMERMCELFGGGDSIADIAVLYHAQAEWSGKRYLPVDNVAKYLMESQRDFDFVDFGALSKAKIYNDYFEIENCCYRALFVPEYEYLPEEYEKLLFRFFGFITVFDGKTENDNGTEGLRVYRYEKNGEYYEMIFNESRSCVDYYNKNRLKYAVDYLRGIYRIAGEHVILSPGEAAVLKNTSDGMFSVDGISVESTWERFDISVMELGADSFTEYLRDAGTDFDINAPDHLPDFSGWVKYSFCADIGGFDGIKVNYRGDACLVSVSGREYVGVDSYVYCMFDDSMRTHGKVKIEIILRNSLAYKIRDKFSKYGYIGACMLDGVSFLKINQQ